MFKDFWGRLLYLPPQKPKTAQIAITNVCNFNCPMCQRFDLKVELRHMTDDVFFVVLNKLKDVPNIILTSWGEPLTHPRIFDYIQKASKNHTVRITTNGALLTPEATDKILNSGLEAITFSIDNLEDKDSFGHPLGEQISNIEYFCRKNQQQGKKIKVFLQSVFLKYDEKIFLDLISFAEKNKIDRLRLTRVDLRFNDYSRPTANEEKKLVQFLEKTLKKSKLTFDFLPYVAFDGIIREIYRRLYPLLHRLGKFCLRTYDDIYVNERGEITPCCSLPNLNCGSLLESDLLTIWQGEKFSTFRKKQEKICGKCDILAIKIR